jgi:hypothetical protein
MICGLSIVVSLYTARSLSCEREQKEKVEGDYLLLADPEMLMGIGPERLRGLG